MSKGFWLRLKRRRTLERDLDDELRFHLDMLDQDHRRFGNLTRLKETSRELFGFGWIDSVWQDLRYGLRMLRKSPALTVAAVVSLALGIGANTAIFSVLNAVILRSLPVEEPERLFVLDRRVGGKYASLDFSYPSFEHLRDRTQTLAALFVFSGSPLRATIDGRAERVSGVLASSNYYLALGVGAARGRVLLPDDDRSHNTVAVISHSFWERRFGKDPAIVGRSIGLNGVACTIVGVTPPGFFGVEVGAAPDVTVPLVLQPRLKQGVSSLGRGNWWLQLVGRLKPGGSTAQAQAELTALFQTFLLQGSGTQTPKMQEMIRQTGIQLRDVSRGLSGVRQELSRPLWVLLGAVGLVMLIVCANVANLLLARAMARQREIAVRLALGAGRLRLVRQFLLESLLLALLGGGLGVLAARWARDALVGIAWKGRAVLEVPTDLRVLLFTVALCAVTPLLFGLAPAWVASKPSDRPASGGRLPLGRLLVVVQVALSLVLLIGAGLFGRSLRKLQNQDLGFRRDHIVLFEINPGEAGFRDARLKAFQMQLTEKMQALPGIEAVAFSRMAPLSSEGHFAGVYRLESRLAQGEELEALELRPVGPGYFETMGIPLVAGRTIGAEDHESAPQVAVVNQAFVRRFFGDEDPIGKRLIRSGTATEIVGVVRNSKYHNLREREAAIVFIPYWQSSPQMRGPMTVELRTAGNPQAAIHLVRQQMAAISTEIPVTGMQTIEAQIGDAAARERLVAILTGTFGAVALLLAAVGLYGVVAYMVTRRTKEMGIRVALGAASRDVLLLILRDVAVMAGLGIAAGLAGAWAGARLVKSLLFGVEPTDAVSITVAVVVLAAVALLAGWIPARRASRVDPITALRYE